MKSLKLFPFLFLLAACTGGTPKYDATGTFEATEVIVSAEASGKLLSFDIEEGTTLKDGQEVGIIDTVQLYLKKLQLEASVKSVEGQRPDILKQVAATQEQIVQARRERDRVSNLLRVGAANQKQLDDAESLLEVLRKQLDAQNSTLRNSDRSLTWQSSSVGIQVAQIEDQLRKCHIIFATVFHTTIEENYDLVRDIYRQIEPFRKRRAGALSGGMKQKLALSCALIHKPDVLFLDEPTTGVDPVSRKEFWGMLRRLKEQGITIIASTPIIDEARQCDRIAFINEGEIKGIDTPDRILTRFAGILCPPGLQHERVENHENKVIEVEGLTKRFGNFTAVDHISFQVHRGEIFGFLGANGAGKTTAMRMLTGLSRPTGGKACVAGFDVASQPEEVKKNIGYMSQKFSLYEDLKVWENIRLFAGIYGIPEAEIAPKTDELLLHLGLEKERDTLVKSLPLGWKQKLAFSVSIFHRPKIVFLDEPTGGVDPATRRQFWELIYQAADEGITVFVTTHFMDEAEYCDRISIMVDGVIRALDTPGELKRQFNATTMDDVFQQLARQAVRTAD